MADSKLTALTALTGANLATSDVFEVSDISDTTMDASGTSKKMTAVELATGIALLKPPSRSVSDTHADSSAVNTTTETVVASQAIPTTVGPGDVVRLVAVGDLLSNAGSTTTYTYTVYVGATSIVSNAQNHSNSTIRRFWRFQADLLVVTAASDQRLNATYQESNNTDSSTFRLTQSLAGTAYAVIAEDLTAGKNIQFAVTMNAASPTADFVCRASWLEVVKR